VLQKRPGWFDFSELLLFILFALLLPFDILLYIFPSHFPYVPSYTYKTERSGIRIRCKLAWSTNSLPEPAGPLEKRPGPSRSRRWLVFWACSFPNIPSLQYTDWLTTGWTTGFWLPAEVILLSTTRCRLVLRPTQTQCPIQMDTGFQSSDGKVTITWSLPTNSI
jgi:hypothetical protein